MSNPYAIAQDTLRKGIYMEHHGPEFMAILIMLYAVQSLNIFLIFATLGLRWKSGKFWLFHIHNLPGGRLIVPNPVVWWLIQCLLFNIFAEFYVRRTVLSGRVGSDMTNYVFWMSTIWIPFWVAVWCWSWSTALTPLLSPTPCFRQYFLPRNHPFLVSLFFIVVALGCVTVILTTSIIANSKFNNLFALFKVLDESLSSSIIAFDAGDFSALPTAEESAAGQTAFQALFDEFLDLFVDMWIGWVVINSIHIAAVVFAVLVQTRDLRQSIADLKLQASQDTAGSKSQSSRHLKELLWSWRTVIITCCITFVSTAVFATIDTPLIVRSSVRAVLEGNWLTEVLRLGSLTFGSLIGSSVNIVLFIFTLRTTQRYSSPSPSNSPARPVKVSVRSESISFWSSEATRTDHVIQLELTDIEKVGPETDKRDGAQLGVISEDYNYSFVERRIFSLRSYYLRSSPSHK